MDFSDNMTRAIDYIEEHLTEHIDYEELAAVSLCSASVFQRVFPWLTGISLSEYIRKRRLTVAGLELQQTDTRITDLAIKYGYESVSSFSRAFQSMHGISPSRARENGMLNSYPKLIFSFSVKGSEAISCRLSHKPARSMIGFKETVSRREETNLSEMPRIWSRHASRCAYLRTLSCESPPFLYGITMNHTEESFDYWIAAHSNEPVPLEYQKLQIPESQWALFQCSGAMPEGQYKIWRRIFSEWLPSSGYCLSDLPTLEAYAPGDALSPDYTSEIQVPVKPVTSTRKQYP